MVRDDCYVKVIMLMERFLGAKANGSSSGFIVDELNGLSGECGDYVLPFIDAVNGVEPKGLTSAISYYMYVAYMMGKIRINKEILNGLSTALDPRSSYSEIYNRLVLALKSGDYIMASFLADLLFIARAYVLCEEYNDNDCTWLVNAFKNRLMILLNY